MRERYQFDSPYGHCGFGPSSADGREEEELLARDAFTKRATMPDYYKERTEIIKPSTHAQHTTPRHHTRMHGGSGVFASSSHASPSADLSGPHGATSSPVSFSFAHLFSLSSWFYAKAHFEAEKHHADKHGERPLVLNDAISSVSLVFRDEDGDLVSVRTAMH